MTIRQAWRPSVINLGERILATPLPQNIDKALQAAAGHFPPGQRFAVRSSAIGEDGEISFAGQYTSVLNVAVPDAIAGLPASHRQPLLRLRALLSHAPWPG